MAQFRQDDGSLRRVKLYFRLHRFYRHVTIIKIPRKQVTEQHDQTRRVLGCNSDCRWCSAASLVKEDARIRAERLLQVLLEVMNAVRRGRDVVSPHVLVHLGETLLDVVLGAALPHRGEAESLRGMVQLQQCREKSMVAGSFV